MVNSVELHAEARRRFLRSNPTITPDAFDAWLADALRHGATVVLQLDGARAEYPRADAPQVNVTPDRGLP